jgi:anti-anti-sigma factor
VGQREGAIVTSEIGDAITELQAEGKGRAMVLDLSDVRMLSSMGLGMCVDLKNQADRAKMRPLLFGVSTTLLELLKLMRVDRLYTVVADQSALDRQLA